MLQPQLKMNLFNIQLLDLPNEILFLILKKLESVNVLYSISTINDLVL